MTVLIHVIAVAIIFLIVVTDNWLLERERKQETKTREHDWML